MLEINTDLEMNFSISGPLIGVMAMGMAADELSQ